MSAERRTAAIVGCGDIAHHHVTGYQLEGVDIVAFVDPLPVARDQFVAEYGTGKGYASLQEMFAKVTPDLVSVCAWHLLHAPLTIEAAAGGVQGITCEKPMAVGMADADRMVEERAERRVLCPPRAEVSPQTTSVTTDPSAAAVSTKVALPNPDRPSAST